MNKKRLITVAAVVVVVIAVLIVAAYNVVNTGKKKTGGRGTNSPYTVEQKKNGNLVITFNTEKIKAGGEWNIDTGEQQIVDVKTSKNSNSRIYTFSPLKEGAVSAIITCNEKNDIDEPVYEITLDMKVTSDKMIELTKETVSDIEKAQKGGADSEHPYIYKVDTDGIMQIYVEGKEDDNWYMQIGDDSYNAEGPVYEDGKWRFSITANKASERNVQIYSIEQNTKIAFYISSDDNGKIKVNSTEMSDYGTVDNLPGQSEYEELLGKQTLPSGVSVYEYSVTDWMVADEGQDPDEATDSAGKIGMAEIYALENKVTYIMSKEVSADLIMSAYTAEGMTVENEQMDDGTVVQYAVSKRDSIIVWQKDSVTYGIMLDNDNVDVLKSIANLFLGGEQNE